MTALCLLWYGKYCTFTNELFYLFYYLQPETEEKSMTYDNIGPNVCMGDHKVCNPVFVMHLCVSLSLWPQVYCYEHVSGCQF